MFSREKMFGVPLSRRQIVSKIWRFRFGCCKCFKEDQTSTISWNTIHHFCFYEFFRLTMEKRVYQFISSRGKYYLTFSQLFFQALKEGEIGIHLILNVWSAFNVCVPQSMMQFNFRWYGEGFVQERKSPHLNLNIISSLKRSKIYILSLRG